MSSTTPAKPAVQPSAEMLRMLNAFLTVQALHVAAVLGVADLLAAGPKSLDDLAAGTKADRPSLHRLLRMLTGPGVFREEADGRFATTPLGATLRSDGSDSVRDWALFVGAPEMWAVWAGLRDSVMSGEASFPAVHGAPMWEYIATRPNLGEAFNGWMTRQSRQHNSALVAAYDFSPFRLVVDVGGGQGSTLAAVLGAHPLLRGVLLDLPQVVTRTTPLDEAGVAARCEVIGGDMLRVVPKGADAYLIKRVLMDWGDADSTTILRRCASAMADGGRVLVVEMLMPTGNDPSPAKTFDILMLLNQPGGRIRTEIEFRELFTASGLRLSRVVPTASPNSILEGVRA
ncbi:MAG: methyltransferase [Chloroflexi bacterium]|nr:MAG: methyltransferase [Chloroflexota bacterium]